MPPTTWWRYENGETYACVLARKCWHRTLHIWNPVRHSLCLFSVSYFRSVSKSKHDQRLRWWCLRRSETWTRKTSPPSSSQVVKKLFFFSLWFQSAKMFNYAGWRKTCNFIFTVFAAVFIVTRLVILPFWYVLNNFFFFFTFWMTDNVSQVTSVSVAGCRFE